METTRRGNYDSGDDFVLEYGELRFTFNERDFGERCEQAAIKLGFVSGRLDEPELEDLVNLVEPPADEAELDRGLLRSEEHTSELQSHVKLVSRLLLEKKYSRED